MTQVAYAAKKARQWTEIRNTWIRKARESGLTLRQIGEEAGLSHTAIRKILNRAD